MITNSVQKHVCGVARFLEKLHKSIPAGEGDADSHVDGAVQVISCILEDVIGVLEDATVCINGLQQACYHGPGCGNIPDDVVSDIDKLEKLIEEALDSAKNAEYCADNAPRAQDDFDECREALDEAATELWMIADDEIPTGLQSLVARDEMVPEE